MVSYALWVYLGIFFSVNSQRNILERCFMMYLYPGSDVLSKTHKGKMKVVQPVFKRRSV